jgi:ABC-2 type transport system permease protein
MVVQPVRVVPYFKHFFFLVVITHLLLAAFYFTVGTLTRNAKIVYGLSACFYPVIIMYGLVILRPLPQSWRTLLDPFMLDSPVRGGGFGHTADYLNQLVVRYSPAMIANRAWVVGLSVACLAILYSRFAIARATKNVERVSILNLSSGADAVYIDGASFQPLPAQIAAAPTHVSLPSVTIGPSGFRTSFDKLLAALAVEFRLLRAERSLIVLLPLTIALSTFELAFYRVIPVGSFSATYASNTSGTLILFLIGLIVFYTGEAMHRDRDLRIESVLWATPVPNSLFLLSKFLGTLCLMLSLIVVVGFSALIIQILRGLTPIELQPYLVTYSIILIPSIVFLAAASVLLNALLRNKYVTYVVSVGTAAALFYSYTVGYNHWLYNPLLYQLWNYSDLIAGTNQSVILVHRIYCGAIAVACLGIADLVFQRMTARGLAGRGRSILTTLTATVIAAGSGLMISGYL